ncbi:hypothetical protein EJA72_11870 [Pseudomonas sp. PB120]|nr:hypothetical protein [Pseudomonas sp. PB120]
MARGFIPVGARSGPQKIALLRSPAEASFLATTGCQSQPDFLKLAHNPTHPTAINPNTAKYP